MAIRDVLIGADENGEGGVGIFRGTSIKDSPNYDSDTVDCFDETVPQGSSGGGGTLEIEKLIYDDMETYIALAKKLMRMEDTPDMITTFEEIKFKGQDPYIIQKNYKDCMVNGNDSEHNPKEHSVRSLKFIYGSVVEKVNGEEIKLD